MEKTLKKIKLSGKEYPYKCSNYVLAQIQDKYGTITDFERKLSGRIALTDENGEPKKNEDGIQLFRRTERSLSAINFMLPLVIAEGMQIEAERKGKEVAELDVKELIRSIDINPFDIADLLLEELYRALAIKK